MFFFFFFSSFFFQAEDGIRDRSPSRGLGDVYKRQLYDYEKELKPGDNLILSAFGGGYTWGAIYVKWAYDGSKACQVDPAEK